MPHCDLTDFAEDSDWEGEMYGTAKNTPATAQSESLETIEKCDANDGRSVNMYYLLKFTVILFGRNETNLTKIQLDPILSVAGGRPDIRYVAISDHAYKTYACL
jgi:hypothetical protein